MPAIDAGLDAFAPTSTRRWRQLGLRHQPAFNAGTPAAASAGKTAPERRRGGATVREDSHDARAVTGTNRRPDTERAPASRITRLAA